MNDSDNNTLSEPIEVVYSVHAVESSVDPPREEWSSLVISIAEENPKKILYNEGLYDPDSGEICAKYITVSASSVLRHPYYCYPPITDPGIEKALLAPEDDIIYPDDGQALYLTLCEEMNQCPVRSFYRGLLGDQIDLRYYCINPNGFRAMSKALQYNKTVQVLNLTDNFLNNDACYHLGDMFLSNNTLTELNLSGCRIGPQGAKRLFCSLHLNCTLKVLDLSRNQLRDEGMEHIAEAVLFGLGVENLNLSYNGLTGRGVELLVKPFETYNHFTHLDLSWNRIFTPGGYAFLMKLSESTCLKVLNLSWNALAGPRLSTALTKILQCPRLNELNLSNNMLKAEGIENLVGGLRKSRKLRKLNLSYNPMTPSDAFSVLEKITQATCKVHTLLMDNVFVTENFVSLLETKKQKKSKKNLFVTYGGVICKFNATGPDPRETVLNRIDFVANKKPKKNKTDIALLAMQLQKDGVEIMDTKQLNHAFRLAEAAIDEDLTEELAVTFPGPGPKNAKVKTMNVNALVDYIKRKWPERQLPPTPPPEPVAPPPQPTKKVKGKK